MNYSISNGVFTVCAPTIAEIPTLIAMLSTLPSATKPGRVAFQAVDNDQIEKARAILESGEYLAAYLALAGMSHLKRTAIESAKHGRDLEAIAKERLQAIAGDESEQSESVGDDTEIDPEDS